MGHYDNAYEEIYAEQRKSARGAAERDIPTVIDDLEAAAQKLRRGVSYIKHASRIEADVQFAISALRGQLGGGS